MHTTHICRLEIPVLRVHIPAISFRQIYNYFRNSETIFPHNAYAINCIEAKNRDNIFSDLGLEVHLLSCNAVLTCR
jgi:hypothetical protein